MQEREKDGNLSLSNLLQNEPGKVLEIEYSSKEKNKKQNKKISETKISMKTNREKANPELK